MIGTLARAEARPHSVEPAIPRHILLVDDDALQLKLSRAYLADAGYRVSTATCASDALDVARRDAPDLILSDIVMGELDGFALCSVFRCDPAFDDTPILLMTASVDGDDARKMALATGAQALIERSAGFVRERETIAQVLRGDDAGHPHPTWRPEPYVSRLATQMSRLLARSREAEDRYRTLFDDASDAIALLTPEGRIVEANRQWEEILGVPRASLTGRHIREFAPQTDTASNVIGFDQSVSRGAKFASGILRGPLGRLIHMEFANKRVTIGGDPMVVSIGRDVTDSVEARHQLAASEENYRMLVENLPDVVWSASLGGKHLFFSPRVEQMCGFTPAELLAADASFWFERVHPQDRPAAEEAYAQIAEQDYSADYRWKRKDGEWIWLRAHARARRDSSGQLFAEGTLTDMTAQKRLEQQLSQAQKMEAVGQLTGGIAHDFNNMLAVILANASLVRDELADGDSRRADVDAIMEAGHRAASLTRQLLAFSRRQMIEPRELNLADTVTDLERMLRRVIGEDITMTISIDPDLGSVKADPGQMEQVLMNLVVNARDAMPMGGRLTIEATNVTVLNESMPGAALMGPGEYVMLAVTDSGTGMPDDVKSRVFEPFFTTKDVGKGTGLGLSTCYGIVKQSKGYIWVYSEVDRGTVFKVYLPRLVEPTPAPGRTEAAGSDAPTGHETILLVEDNEQLRVVVKKVLARQGYTVFEAADGQEAMAVHGQHSGGIDLIVTDVVVPGLSGPDLVSLIRHRDPKPRALFMSGYTEHAALRDRRLGTGLGFVQKPFAPAAIVRKVREVLDAGAAS